VQILGNQPLFDSVLEKIKRSQGGAVEAQRAPGTGPVGGKALAPKLDQARPEKKQR